ncbi:hypothetical protein [Streptomyces sp. NPDC051704]
MNAAIPATRRHSARVMDPAKRCQWERGRTGGSGAAVIGVFSQLAFHI